jgi:hypothetical protein
MAELTPERVYIETCANIRATDDISFKLLGFVPFLSGATLMAFFLKEPFGPEKAPLIITLSIFAALITFGLFRWELRNIQTCSWLRLKAKALEKEIIASAKVPEQPNPPLRIGKTEAAKLIYSITIVAWLLLPTVVPQFHIHRPLLGLHITFAVCILIVTLLSAFWPIRVTSPQSNHPTPSVTKP